MQGKISGHIRANAIGYVALFIAMSGTAVAASRPNVLSSDIRRGAVTSHSIRDNSVQGVDVQTETLEASDVAPDTLTGAQIDESTLDVDSGATGEAGGALTGTYPDPQIASGAVGTDQLAAGAVTSAKLGNGSVSGGTGGVITDNSIAGADVNESGLDTTVLQSRVTGTCSSSQAVQSVNQDGTVTCGSPEDSRVQASAAFVFGNEKDLLVAPGIHVYAECHGGTSVDVLLTSTNSEGVNGVITKGSYDTFSFDLAPGATMTIESTTTAIRGNLNLFTAEGITQLDGSYAAAATNDGPCFAQASGIARTYTG